MRFFWSQRKATKRCSWYAVDFPIKVVGHRNGSETRTFTPLIFENTFSPESSQVAITIEKAKTTDIFVAQMITIRYPPNFGEKE